MPPAQMPLCSGYEVWYISDLAMLADPLHHPNPRPGLPDLGVLPPEQFDGNRGSGAGTGKLPLAEGISGKLLKAFNDEPAACLTLIGRSQTPLPVLFRKYRVVYLAPHLASAAKFILQLECRRRIGRALSLRASHYLAHPEEDMPHGILFLGKIRRNHPATIGS